MIFHNFTIHIELDWSMNIFLQSSLSDLLKSISHSFIAQTSVVNVTLTCVIFPLLVAPVFLSCLVEKRTSVWNFPQELWFYAVTFFYLKLYCNSYVLKYNLGNDWVPFLFICSFKDQKEYIAPRGKHSMFLFSQLFN